MKVLNFIGTPGVGKTTLASAVFAEMKMADLRVEFVQETAKQMVAEKNFKMLRDRFYMIGLTHYLVEVWRGETDFVVNEFPVFNNLLYPGTEGLEEYALKAMNDFENINFVVGRKYPYVKDNRNETEEVARALDKKLEELLFIYGIPYYKVESTPEAAKAILEIVVRFN